MKPNKKIFIFLIGFFFLYSLYSSTFVYVDEILDYAIANAEYEVSNDNLYEIDVRKNDIAQAVVANDNSKLITSDGDMVAFASSNEYCDQYPQLCDETRFCVELYKFINICDDNQKEPVPQQKTKTGDLCLNEMMWVVPCDPEKTGVCYEVDGNLGYREYPCDYSSGEIRYCYNNNFDLVDCNEEPSKNRACYKSDDSGGFDLVDCRTDGTAYKACFDNSSYIAKPCNKRDEPRMCQTMRLNEDGKEVYESRQCNDVMACYSKMGVEGAGVTVPKEFFNEYSPTVWSPGVGMVDFFESGLMDYFKVDCDIEGYFEVLSWTKVARDPLHRIHMYSNLSDLHVNGESGDYWIKKGKLKREDALIFTHNDFILTESVADYTKGPAWYDFESKNDYFTYSENWRGKYVTNRYIGSNQKEFLVLVPDSTHDACYDSSLQSEVECVSGEPVKFKEQSVQEMIDWCEGNYYVNKCGCEEEKNGGGGNVSFVEKAYANNDDDDDCEEEKEEPEKPKPKPKPDEECTICECLATTEKYLYEIMTGQEKILAVMGDALMLIYKILIEIKDSVVEIKDAIGGISGGDGSSGGGSFWDMIASMFETLADLVEFIIEKIVYLIVPEDSGFLTSRLNKIIDSLKMKFEPLEALKTHITAALITEQKNFEDIYINLPYWGTVKFLDVTFMNSALPIARNFISGVMIIITGAWAYRKIGSGLIK